MHLHRSILLLVGQAFLAAAGPCDIYATHGTPCAAAHSVVRALFSAYGGRLYQLKRFGDNATLDILPLSAGGFADAASHEAFCAANPAPPPPPPPPPPPAGLPALGTIVRLAPSSAPSLAFRHCYSQGYVTPEGDSGDDHRFKLQAALTGDSSAISLESVNYPAQYIASMPGDEGRAGIVPAPAAADASWAVAAAAGGGFTLTSLAPARGALTVGADLNGTCAHSYAPPSASVYLTAAGTAWAVTPDSGLPPYPPRADCVIQIIYDQANSNHLLPATPAINNPNFDNPVNATRHPVSVGGHKVYGAYFESGMGYRAQNTTAVARDNEPETLYMITSGTHYNAGCCFDYGNSENDCNNPGAYCDGCMEAIYFGSGGGWCGGGGAESPTVLADLENGLWGCATPNGDNKNLTSLPYDFVTAMVKGGVNGFALKGGNAGGGTAGTLATMWDGPRPPGYQPMHKTGAIILGVGGDNVSRRAAAAAAARAAASSFSSPAAVPAAKVGGTIPGTSIGTFYEGVLTVGYSTDEADDAVQADIIAAGYGQ